MTCSGAVRRSAVRLAREEATTLLSVGHHARHPAVPAVREGALQHSWPDHARVAVVLTRLFALGGVLRLTRAAHARRTQTQVKDLGSGNFGLARLERDVATNALVAIKYLPRGATVRAPQLVSTLSTRNAATASCREPPPLGPSAWHHQPGVVAHLRDKRHKEAWARGVVACWACARWAPGLVCRFPECGHPHVFPASSQVDENVARELVCHRMLRHNNVVLFKEARPFGHRALCQSRSLLAR